MPLLLSSRSQLTLYASKIGGLIFYRYPGTTVPHHVVIYLGRDRILQAPETGQNVGYDTLSEFTGQTASVRRITEP